jgi:hypothetical protein
MPACGADPFTNTSLPLSGNHGCAICKVELLGPCEVFFSDDSIKYQICAIVIAKLSKLWLIPHYLQMLIVTQMSKALLMPCFLQKIIVKWNKHQLQLWLHQR